MDLILTDAAGRDAACVSDFELDMAIGEDENDFELTVAQDAPGWSMGPGCLVYADGSDEGGVIDSVTAEVTRSGTRLTASGRTWSGVLAGKVVLPEGDWYEWDGEANACIAGLLARVGLDGPFAAEAADSGIRVSWRFARFCDAWSGLRDALRSAGAKPRIRFAGGRVEVGAVPSARFGGVDGDAMDFTMTRNARPVNHLVCAGSGELADREVIHFYADANGVVSHAQSLFGRDEVTELYDYSNADDLEAEGRKKLEELQDFGSVAASVRDGEAEMDVGDVAVGRDMRSGISVTAEVVKKVVKVKKGVRSVDYECGGAYAVRTAAAPSRRAR